MGYKIGNEDDEDLEFDLCECDDYNYFNGKDDCGEEDSEEEYEPSKDKHGISILMNVNSEDAGVIRDALVKAGHVRTAEDFETRRELGIMHELKEKGLVGLFESWSKDTYGKGSKKPRYKMKHKILAK